MWSRLIYGGKDVPYNYSKFVCDSISDLAELPTNQRGSTKYNVESCSVGSLAIVIEDSSVYILNNKNEWKLYKSSSSEISNIDVATIEEFKNYIDI